MPVVSLPVKCHNCLETSYYNEGSDGNDYCFTCFKDNFVKCYECAGIIDKSDSHKGTDNESYCEICFYDQFINCDRCDKLTFRDECSFTNDGDSYCDRCYNLTHTECEGCSEYFHNSNLTSEMGDYCVPCFDERFFHCDVCTNTLARDDVYVDDGQVLCESCHDNNEEWEPGRWSGCSEYDKVGSSRRFGIELESSECDGYADWARFDNWGAKKDGSIDGMEFVSPPLYGNDGYDSVIEFCRIANKNGVRVDRDCGYHLHIDLSDTNKHQRKAIALAYHYTRNVWALFVDPSRRDINYARYHCEGQYAREMFKGKYWDRKDIIWGDDHPNVSERYLWCNWRSFAKHKTVEIRSHEATFDGRAVINWARAHTKFVDHVRVLTIGQIGRKFGNEENDIIMKELRHTWNDDSLWEFYRTKSGLVAE